MLKFWLWFTLLIFMHYSFTVKQKRLYSRIEKGMGYLARLRPQLDLRYFLRYSSFCKICIMSPHPPLPYPASIWRLLTNFQRKNRRYIFEEMAFSDVMFRDFGSKIGKCLQASRMYMYEVKQSVNAKGRKIERAAIWLSRIFDIFRFWP